MAYLQPANQPSMDLARRGLDKYGPVVSAVVSSVDDPTRKAPPSK